MHTARIAVRQPQQRVDQRRQTVDLLEHAADGFLVLGRRAGFDQTGFADAANHGERRPQFVRRVGREAAQLVERRLEPRERIVDHGRQAADFVVLIRDGDAFMQALGSHPPGFGRQVIDRRQRPAREEVSAKPARTITSGRPSTSTFSTSESCSRRRSSDRDTRKTTDVRHQRRAGQRPPAPPAGDNRFVVCLRTAWPARPAAMPRTRPSGRSDRRSATRRRCRDPRRCRDRGGDRRTMRPAVRRRRRRPSADSKSSWS